MFIYHPEVFTVRKFHQIFWVALPTIIYSLFWAIWSFVLLRPVPVVGKFLWNSGIALKKIMPNLPNPHDQFIYFPVASRWWDAALAPIGALVLVLLYYNKKFNDEDLAYEDINFSWGKLIRDITNPFLRPYYVWKEKRHELEVARSMAEAKDIHNKPAINDTDAKKLDEHIVRMYGEVQRLQEESERKYEEFFMPRMEGIKTMMVYCLTICLGFGTFFGLLLGPAKGPFGFIGLQVLIGCLIGPIMLLSRRWQIAVMTHLSCWVGLWYGFSIGIGMIPALCWTSYMFVPTGLAIALISYFRSTRRKETAPTLL